MADQSKQRVILATQAGDACKQFLSALHQLQNLAERRAFLGNFTDAELVSALPWLDAATIGTLFDFVVPDLLTAYNDAGNSGRAKQILNQVAQTL